MPDLEIFDDGETLYVDSRLIAERLGIEHRSFFQTISDYETQIEQAFGVLRFENAKPLVGSQGGRPQRYALLNEDQATFVMTLSRNSPEVVQCKLDLVRSFSKAKDLLKQRHEKASKQIPYWYERIKIALSDTTKPLQAGYFCAYLEMMKFFQELEVHADYVVLDTDPQTGRYIVPDISIGKMFNSWLQSPHQKTSTIRNEYLGVHDIIDFRKRRQNRDKTTGEMIWVDAGPHNHEILTYCHVYPEISHGSNNRQDVNSYPDKYLPLFKYYLKEIWIPNECSRYIKERDPEGWTQALEKLAQLPSISRRALAGTFIGGLLPALPPDR